MLLHITSVNQLGKKRIDFVKTKFDSAIGLKFDSIQLKRNGMQIAGEAL
jgi:hypothetical protein